jgi:transcriptional regulator with XRE-family HTH domain
MDRFVPIGERLAAYRRRRGLSQAKLAHLVGRSESWLSQIERGERPIQRLGPLAELAKVLEVPMTELIGTEPKAVRDPAEQHAAVEQLRLVLSGFDFLALLLQPGRAQTAAEPELPQLRADVARAWELVHASRYTELAPLLSSLLSVGERDARAAFGDVREETFGLVAQTYQVVAAMMAKLGETELAWVAADRAVMAAERAGAPLLAVAGVYRLAQAFVAGWKLDQAERAASSGALGLAGRLHDGDPEIVSLYGALNLVRAIVASRRGDAVTAWQALAEAETAARLLGADRNDFDTEFGPTNVQLHAVAVAVELAECREALRRAGIVQADGLSPERQARLLIDVARAHGQRRDSAGATGALRQAAALTAEQVKYHPLVRELVRDLLRRRRRVPDSDLTAIALAVGMD